MEKKNCIGCYNDDYNHGLGGAKECWNLNDAKLVERLAIRSNQIPPFKNIMAKKVPSCYSKKEWCFVNPEAITKEGYWK